LARNHEHLDDKTVDYFVSSISFTRCVYTFCSTTSYYTQNLQT